MATVLPSDDNDTDEPELSPDASPSISFPIFCQGNKGIAVGGGVGEGVGKYGDDGSKIGGSVVTLFGLVLFVLDLYHKTKKSVVHVATRRNTSGFRV